MKHFIFTLIPLTVLLHPVYSSGQQKAINSDLKIEIMDQQRFENLTSDESKLHHIIILTTGCGATPFELGYLGDIRKKYKDSINSFLIFSDRVKDSNYVKKVAAKYGMNGDYYILGRKYKKKLLDDRKKGYNFRNIICEDCKPDVIGTPYNILIRNKKVLFHGYRYYKNTYPADIVTYFIRQ